MKTTTTQLKPQTSGEMLNIESAKSTNSVVHRKLFQFSVVVAFPILLASCNEESSEGKYEKIGKAVDRIEKVIGPIEEMAK